MLVEVYIDIMLRKIWCVTLRLQEAPENSAYLSLSAL